MFDTQPKEVEIDGTKFKLYLLDATVGHPLYVKLLKVVGPALIEMFAARGDEDETAWGQAISKLLKELDPALVTELCNAFAPFSDVETEAGKTPRVKAVFGRYFAGRYVHMTKWLVECCKHNFADFFDGSSLTNALGSLASTSR